THDTATAAFANHWNTPSSVLVDALGRAVKAVARNGIDASDWITTRSAYDIQGNLVAITDALGREAFRYTYDLANRRWRVDSLDAGRHDTVLDVFGGAIEMRDANGGLSLASYDLLHRPKRTWARDDAMSPVTLRHRFAYGDEEGDRNAAREANWLGRLVKQHD